MKEKIEQLANGIFRYELPEIRLSQEALQLEVETGESRSGEFTISNSKETNMKCILYSSNQNMVLSRSRFTGKENVISYCFHAEQLEAGETVCGNISIISDCGETDMPFQVKVEPPMCETSIGKIHDLFQFANLAKSDWLEAKQLFRSEKFLKMINYYDKKYTLLYNHLLMGSVGSRAMEEFLVAVHKKLRINFSLEKNSMSFDPVTSDIRDYVAITKDTWGFAELRVRTDADFISFERRMVRTEDFYRNRYELGFQIIYDKLRKGRNFGRVFFTSMHQTITLSVMCCKQQDNGLEHIQNKKNKQCTVKLVQNYLKFRMNSIAQSKYVSEAEGILSAMGEDANTDIYAFYRIHLMIVDGKEEMARIALSIYRDELDYWKDKSVICYGAILYLDSMLKKNRKEMQERCEELHSLYNMNQEEWWLLWFVLYTDRRLMENRMLRLEAIRDQLKLGCTSPILYYEALACMNEEPALLKDIHEDKGILSFGTRNQFISKGLTLQFAYLASREKRCTPVMVSLLCRLYERNRQKECLMAVCSLLIRGRHEEAAYHKWYRLGVEEQLKLAELNEYYLNSITDESKDELIPQQALLYFVYNAKLSDRKKELLYADVIKYKDKYPSIYSSYERQIRDYALAQLEKGNTSEELEIIYNRFLAPALIDERLAIKIPDIAFKQELICDNRGVKGVCVIHKELDAEAITPLINGKAYIDIFTENAEVLLVDENNSRYSATIDYTMNKLFHMEELIKLGAAYLKDNEKLLLHMAEEAMYKRADSESEDIFRSVLQLKGISSEYKKECELKLIYFYYDNLEGEKLEGCLRKLDLTKVSRLERMKMIEFMIIRELYHSALKAIGMYGYEGLNAKRLLKLCSSLITLAVSEEEEGLLTRLCIQVFHKGKYNDTLLKYLVEKFYGSTLDMLALWKAARDFDLDTTDIEERMLGQMLFAECYATDARTVFRNYYHRGCNSRLIKAFLSYFAYGYLLNDKVLEQDFFDIMRREMGYEKNDVCMLALMKNYSTREEYTEAEKKFITVNLKHLYSRNLFLPCFKNFEPGILLPGNMKDKQYVEYHADQENKVMIHYSYGTAEEEEGYRSEEMHNVFGGIFIKEFVVFYNEHLQYYISEDGSEGTMVTESAEIKPELSVLDNEESKYQRLNLIITAREMNDDKTVTRLLEDYVNQEHYTEMLFTAI